MTTGEARVSASHCQKVNCTAGTIARAITGTVSTSDTSSRCRSDRVGSSSSPGSCASVWLAGGAGTAAV